MAGIVNFTQPTSISHNHPVLNPAICGGETHADFEEFPGVIQIKV